MRRILNWITSVVHAGGTGGLNWHLHARQSLPRWQPTLKEIERFLMGLRIQERHLILIGGSAGWMMPTAWLRKVKIPFCLLSQTFRRMFWLLFLRLKCL